MPILKSRVPFTPENPLRTVRPSTDKIIFLSFEGSVTEEEYFDAVSEVFYSVKSKIQFISVAEDAVNTHHKCRTLDQKATLCKTRPLQLVERIDIFKEQNKDKYEFEQYLDDEFWIVTDVDKNWSSDKISKDKTYKDEWDVAISLCKIKGYGYAVSNPFFEVWLLLHHDELNDNDTKYAITETHEYEPTSHFKDRLKELGFPLQHKKHIKTGDYTEEKIRQATARASALHRDSSDLEPHYLSTTAYILIEKILEMV